jgi:hypothetical protein
MPMALCAQLFSVIYERKVHWGSCWLWRWSKCYIVNDSHRVVDIMDGDA